MPKKAPNPQKQLVQQKTAELIVLCNEFCGLYLDSEYRDLCQKLIHKLARKREVPFLHGRLSIWAAAIIHALGTANFLFDKSFEPFVTASEIAEHFGAAMSTVSNKSKQIRDMFNMHHFDNEFTTSKMEASNPFKDLVLVNGVIVPISKLPPMMQKILREHQGDELEFELLEEEVNEESHAMMQAQIKRVAQILGAKAGQAAMMVSMPNFQRYREYLQAQLPWPFQATGIVDLPPFDWELPYLDGPMNKQRRQKYEQLCKERPCGETDLFELTGLSESYSLESGLMYEACRLSDQKRFLLPIHAMVEEEEFNEQVEPLIEDYISWLQNCGFGFEA